MTFGSIDVVCNFEFADGEIARPAWSKEFIREKIGADAAPLGTMRVEDLLEKMDRAGVEHAFLIAVKAGSEQHKISRRISYEQVAEVVAAHPTRFSGLAGVDPTEGMRGLRELQRAVTELGFVGAHLYPHWFEMAPDHARYYPIYAKCAELDIPIQLQVGHCLRYSEERPLRSVGRPITLDTVACDFPELKLIGIHIGWPWTEEMIAVAYKHPNVYIGSDAYAPKHWSPEFVRFIDSWGQDKVLFGTDYPVIDPERAMKEIGELAIRDTSRRKFLRDNAIDLYGLDLPRAEDPLVRNLRRAFVDTSQGQVHLRHSPGEGEPLVLLHASPGSSAMLVPLLTRLATPRPLYALDTLGNGDSDPPLTDEPDIAYFAGAATEALDALGIGRCALYGTHTGAHLATEMALTRPERYSRLVIDGMGLYTRTQADGFEDRYTPVVEPSPDGAQLWWAWHFVRNGYLSFPWFSERAEDRTRASLPPAAFLHAKTVEVLKALGTYRHSYRAAFRYPKRDKLARLRLPTLVTLGEQDVLRPYFDELVAAVPGAAGALIEAADFEGHFDALAKRLDAFLTEPVP